MIKLASDTIDKNDINLLTQWLNSDEYSVPKLTKGEISLEFEKRFSEIMGVKHSVFVNSGSSAILLTALALIEGGYLRNKKIIIPALSWLTDPSSFIVLGYEVILCDCNLHDLSLDLNHLDKLLTEHDCATTLVVSVLGLVPDMDELLRICNKHNSLLLEDTCESMGSEYKGKKLSSMGFAGFHSCYFGHIISTIEGGIITTNDKNFYELLVSLRSHGWSRDLSEETQLEWQKPFGKIDDFNKSFQFYHVGQNFRPTDLQAYIGLNQLIKLPNYIRVRNHNFKQYQEILGVEHNELKLLDHDYNLISNMAYPMVNKNRNELVNKLRLNNIEVRPLIAGDLSKQPFWIKRYGHPNIERNGLKNCDLIHNYGFYLPNHQDLTVNDIKFIKNVAFI